MNHSVRALLEEGCRRLDLPPWLVEGRVSGSLSILVGMACILPDLVPPRWILEGVNPRKAYLVRPRRSINPVGFILSHYSLESPEETFQIAKKEGLREALMIGGTFRAPFREFITEQINHARVLLRNHQHEINGRDEIRPALLKHFRELWRLLEAEEIKGATRRARIESARTQVEAKYRELAKKRGTERKTSVFIVNPDQARVERRGEETVLDRLTRLGNIQKRWEKKATQLIRRQGVDPEEDQQVVYEEQGVKKAAQWLGKNLKSQASQYPCSVGVPRDLGRAEVCRIIATVARLETDTDIVLACSIFGLCAYESVRFGTLSCASETINFFRTKVQVPQNQPGIAPHLYRKRAKWFIRPLPQRLAERFKEVRGAWRKRFMPAWEKAPARLKVICPSATLAKLNQALIVHGEHWFGLPWVVAENAFRPKRLKFPAPRSYTHLSTQLVRRTEPFLKLVDPSFKMPVNDWSTGTGSALVPMTSMVRDLVAAWQKYLSPAPVMEMEELIPHWNAAAAGMHIFVLLLSGLRNHPMDGLSLDHLRGRDWGMIKQKGEPFAFYLSPILRSLLKQIRTLWGRVDSELKKLKVNLLEDRSLTYSYGFLRCSTSAGGWGQLAYATPSHNEVVEAFLSRPSLRKFAKLDRKWTRHFSNTCLREAGFSEIQVRAFHGHADFMLHPFRRHRLEPLVPKSVLRTMVDCLAREIGLSDERL